MTTLNHQPQLPSWIQGPVDIYGEAWLPLEISPMIGSLPGTVNSPF